MTTLQGVIVTPSGISTDSGQADSGRRPALSPVASSAHRPGAALARLGGIGSASGAAARFGVSEDSPPNSTHGAAGFGAAGPVPAALAEKLRRTDGAAGCLSPGSARAARAPVHLPDVRARMPVSVTVMPPIVDQAIDGMEDARRDREAQGCDSKMEDVVRAQQETVDTQLMMEELRALQRMEEAKASVVKAAGQMIRDAARPH